MKFRVITIPFSSKTEGFSTEELNEFTINKKGVNYSVNFFQNGNKSYWTVLLSYEEEISKKEELKFKHEYENQLFEELKNWRNERAEKEGIPPYIIFTNKQLKQIII